MRLRRLDLTRYGRFTDRRLDFGEAGVAGAPDFHVVYGLNEAGKSTTLAAFLDLLFGIEERSRYGFLHDYRAMEIGGRLEWNGVGHELVRRKQRAGSLTDPAGRVLDENLLAGALSGLGREAYRTMFSLDDETLEQGGDAILQSRGDLGEMLFSASSGLGRLGAQLARLAEEADTIRKGRARSTEIAVLKARLADLKEKREAIDTVAAAYRGLTEALATARGAYEAAMDERRALSARLDRTERLARALPLAREAERLEADLEPLAERPRPPPDFARDLPDLLATETRLTALGGTADEAAARLQAEIAALQPDTGLLREAPAIRRLTERLGAVRAGADERPRLDAALAEREAALAALLAALGRPNEAEPARLLLPAATEDLLAALSEARAALAERLEAAEAERVEAEDAERRALAAAATVAEPGADGDLTRLAAALAASRAGDAPARLALARREEPGLARRLADALDALHPWRGGVAALRALPIPDARRIEMWRGTAAAIERRRESERERLREAETRRGGTQARLDRLGRETGAIGDEEADTLRRRRDAAWAQHRAELTETTADAFAILLQADDRLAEARLAKARDLAELREAARESSAAVEAERRARELIAEAEAEAGALADEIAAALPPELVGSTRDPARLAEWIDAFARRRETALLAADAEAEARERAEAAAAEIEADRRRLEAALEAAGIEPGGEAAELGPLAEAALAARTRSEAAREGAARRLAEAEAALALRRTREAAATAALSDWTERWEAALGATWIEAREPAAVRGLLKRLAGLAGLIAERDGLRRRIASAKDEAARFADDVAALAGRLGRTEPADTASDEALERFAALLDTAAREAELRAAKERDLADLTEKRRGYADDGARLDARRTEMTAFFGVSSLAEVGEAIGRDAEHRRAEARLAELRAAILTETGAASPATAAAFLAGAEPEAVAGEQDALRARLGDLDALAQTRFAERSVAEAALARVGGDDAVARIQAERQTILIEMEEAGTRWLRLKAGLLVAQGALAAFRENHRSTMMARASQSFAAMTRGAYRGLAAQGGRERETLIGVAEDGASKLAETMSKGTRFQLYLALRLAGYEEFAAQRTPVPFLADDIMETFDEPRSEEVLRLLGRLSRTGQVVYLTHHRHLCDIARSVEPAVRIHEI